MTRPTWDDSFLAIAREAAKRSKDESTKVGSVIVGPDNEIRSIGYNCFPRGINDDAPERHTRPKKYLYFEHAERNAIYNAARVGIPLKGCSIYLSWLPCADCARAIIQAGISGIVTDNIDIPDRWQDSIKAALEMLGEAGVPIRVANAAASLDPRSLVESTVKT